MNEVVKSLMNHRSYRQYLDRQVKEENLNTIIKAAQAAPSWIHGQQVSIISIKDPIRKDKLAQLCGNQNHIRQAPIFLVFCADFYRAKLCGDLEGMTLEALHQVDSLLVGATDVGLSMSYAIAAAESLGLGTVPIGGIRRNSLDVTDLLELPKYVIPISGLCLGYGAEEPAQKPRLPQAAVLHDEKYNPQQEELLQEYNRSFFQFERNQTGNETSTLTWSKRVANFYKNPYYLGVEKMLQKQGFNCEDISKQK
ncbi:NADPH-dependent oxidoreductase [Bacillus sp. 03113]|uniref:NADPH-dependent oxidoreductase n=1 Tax=Bacillus sp. 03113 TaxID=2578211 RepID=UPI0011423C84|nr:NADPH-dependent oxidoreductase [Bacillus sp. 03113]